MYLKRLQLHGFKSFAARTALDFSPGITGIVGPNGSGKSNIADGLRWVLGEQSMRQLRGKKSEDIIFAGGRGRPALGMAEVTLTFDNSTQWLPSEFGEVTVTRRAFRSGESDYFINGTKVRLKDMLNLLSQARIGHDSYTIIGQGLVDQALSARAEERRGLFEDAAGIRHFQAQRSEAEQRLTQTHVNLSRLHDILSEIEPRLGPLAEQARRARDFITARSELDRMLSQWYGHQWHTALALLTKAEAAETSSNALLDTLRTTIAAHEAAQHEARTQREQLLGSIGDLRRQRAEASSRVQGIERDLAVARERASSLERARAEMHDEQTHVQQGLGEAEAQVLAMTAALTEAEAAISGDQQALEAMEHDLHLARQQQEREEARLRSAQRDFIQAQAKLSSAQAELARLNRQLDDRRTKLDARRAATATAASGAAAAQEHADQLRASHETERSALGDRLVQREGLLQTIATTQEELEGLRLGLSEMQSERRALADRLELLRQWAGTELDGSAALASLATVPDDERPRILGEIAELAVIEPKYELALEVALGPFLHALVAASEDDAWRGAELLRDRHNGRVIIVWPVAHPVIQGAGDLATKLGSATPPEVAMVLHTLLGGINYSSEENFTAVRWNLAKAPVVTVHGEVAHPDGWLAIGRSGSGAEESVLVRARELRELPERLAICEEQVRLHSGLVANARAALDGYKADLATLNGEIKTRESQLSEGARVLGQAQREAERLANEVQITSAVEQQLATELVTLAEEIAVAEERYGEAHAAQRDLAEVADESQRELEAVQTAARSNQEEFTRRRTALAVRQQEIKAMEQRLMLASDQARELRSQSERRGDRLAELERQHGDVAAAIERYGVELSEQRTITQRIHAELQHYEAEAAQADKQINDLEIALAAARVEMAQREGDYRRMLVDAQRARDGISVLRTQMAEEMDETDLRAITAEDAIADEVILSAEESSRMRKQIDSLRGRIKQLGGYDPEAPQAYEELRTRYEFLTAQVRDMEDASARLRAVIMELDTTMRRRFEETFQAVNERFQRHFVTLFQGGAARLELTAPRRSTKQDSDEEDELAEQPQVTKRGAMTGGIEVFVQIPGKKVQDLGLLSGGERAMVSAALLFALLETNPPPFCLLDEVDAALDEANVVRFCEILRTLADQTQFIVITHNRVTMTHANALYGVSMTESVSRMLSMRLAEAQSA